MDQLAESVDGSPDLAKPDPVETIYARRKAVWLEQFGDEYEPTYWGQQVDRRFIQLALERGHEDPFGDQLDENERRALARLWDVATAEILEDMSRTNSTLAREWRSSRFRFLWLPRAPRELQRPRPRSAPSQPRSRRSRVTAIRGPPSQDDDSEPHLAPWPARWLATIKAGDG